MTINRTGLKETILDRCNELDIYSHYCGIKVIPGRTMKSPLREGDKNPSFNVFKTKDGRYMFKDFAGQSGDVFKFVMLMFNIDFSDACKRISFDMKVDTNPAFERIAKIKSRFTLINIHSVEKKEKAVVTYKELDAIDPVSSERLVRKLIDFFINHNILFKMKDDYDLFLPTEFSVNKYSWNEHFHKEDFAIGIKYPSGNTRFYRPNAKFVGGLKHIGNSDSSDIFGMRKLMEQQEVSAVIICAGQKDTMVLQSLLNKNSAYQLNIRCICLNSESCSLSVNQYMDLRSKTDKIYSIYDVDQTGMKYAQKLQDEYGIKSLSRFITPTLSGKDVADYCNHGQIHRNHLYQNIINIIE